VGIIVPLSVLGGIGNGYAGTSLSTLVLARTPDSARGRVAATANAIFGGAQGASLLLGGAVAVALSPRAIYALAGFLGLAVVGIVAVTHAPLSSVTSTPTAAEPAPIPAVTTQWT
jgi:MFS family permease